MRVPKQLPLDSEREELHRNVKREARLIADDLTVDERRRMYMPWGGIFEKDKHVFPVDEVGES